MKNKIKKFLVKGNICNQDNSKNAGITLVALVITIIVLLILAGISIAQLTGNGLFEKAKTAKEVSKNAQDYEEKQIAKYTNDINSYVDGNRGTVTISQEEYNRLLKSSNSNNYSRNEQVIGTWIDGKILYQKSIEFGALPNSTTKSVSHNINDIDTICSVDAIGVTVGGNNIPIPYTHYNAIGAQIKLDVNSTNITIESGYNFSQYNGYITIKYTKTTD